MAWKPKRAKRPRSHASASRRWSGSPERESEGAMINPNLMTGWKESTIRHRATTRWRCPSLSLSRSSSKNCSHRSEQITILSYFSSSLRLKSGHILQQRLLVPLRDHVGIHLADDTYRIDDERRAVPVEVPLVFGLSDAERLQES